MEHNHFNVVLIADNFAKLLQPKGGFKRWFNFILTLEALKYVNINNGDQRVNLKSS